MYVISEAPTCVISASLNIHSLRVIIHPSPFGHQLLFHCPCFCLFSLMGGGEGKRTAPSGGQRR